MNINRTQKKRAPVRAQDSGWADDQHSWMRGQPDVVHVGIKLLVRELIIVQGVPVSTQSAITELFLQGVLQGSVKGINPMLHDFQFGQGGGIHTFTSKDTMKKSPR